MANTREVSVGAPDDLGLRKVTIDGKTVGKAWSPWELKRFLDRAGVDPEHEIHWFGGDSTVWPDKGGWRRRTIGFFVFVGLLATVCPLFRIGMADSGDALTYGGRIAGFTILVASVVEFCAALACIDYWGKRRWRYSGVVVLAGVLIALFSGIALLLLLIGERFTGYTVFGMALTLWSSLALAELVKSRAWKGLHNPRKIAIGAIISTLLAGANLAYSQIYVPYVKTPLVESGAEFKDSNLERQGGPLFVTVHLYVKNEGEVPVYVLDSKYWVHGVAASNLSDKPVGSAPKGAKAPKPPEESKDELLYDGDFVAPVGRVLNPGEEIAQDAVVEVDGPESRTYEAVRAQTEVYVVRKDRMRVPPEYASSGIGGDDLKALAGKEKVPRGAKYMYRSEVSNSSEILNVARGPQRITLFRVERGQWPRVVVDVSPPRKRIDLDPRTPVANKKLIERYGLSVVRGSTAEIPYQELLEKARAVQKQAEPPK
ncbi:hypothetical protein [Streptomyces sp. NPDC002467]|uniref:hypothetical protein n=1 Tax=Streptomyces sp. NPDC002467 TaxID=3364647 RepID=UPI0036AAC59F